MENQQAMETETTQLTRILVAVSHSTIHGYPHASISSTRAFEFVLKKIIRAEPSRFKILILHVQQPDELEERHERARQMLSHFDRRCRDNGVACQFWVKGGRPERVILHELNRVKPDLLVVGSRGLGWVRRFFIGSISEVCAKNVECPILIVKRKPADTPSNPADD